VQSLVGSVILGLVQPLGGALADTLGLQGMFLAFGAMTLTFGLGALLLWNRAEVVETSGENDTSQRGERAVEVVATS
jgi:nitrate/nitrite transporter NarK